ncbi:imm11 family protein [Novipirellula artificiosorum]|uniref:Immunity MXAN-0049 protein domain-containing protein n=1 Tax=Novipirellula artificiosorum TaxID=2528016 RepID=A0A5C6DXN6_9BACT|nr:DUF1629 domain-containing protein [Novipirellula artificiosorum]TWU40597.1 hypothetical protein Poly41_14300 [Novipirellula artificiosorum]
MTDRQQSNQPPYFMLTCYSPANADYIDIESYPEIDGIDSWLLGTPLSVDLSEPIRLQWDRETEGPPKKMYADNIPLMHRDLVTTLQQCGVTNLQLFPTEIVHPENKQVERDYLATNILGLIKAADLSESNYRDPSGNGLYDMDFDSLAIDPQKTFGAKLFRLAECVTGIVIARSVKESLQQAGGFGLQFVEPADWIG